MGNMKIRDNAIIDSENQLVVDTNGGGTFVPLGSIIAISKISPSGINFEDYINTNFWRLCNGGSVNITRNDSTTFSVNVPDLTDSRFLVGTSSGNANNNISGFYGGNNNGHYHSGAIGNFNSLDYNNVTINNHIHAYTSTTWLRAWYRDTEDNGQTKRTGREGLSSNVISTGSPSAIDHIHSLSNNFGASIVGALSPTDGGNPASNGDSIGSNIPLYLGLRFYMRIK